VRLSVNSSGTVTAIGTGFNISSTDVQQILYDSAVYVSNRSNRIIELAPSAPYVYPWRTNRNLPSVPGLVIRGELGKRATTILECKTLDISMLTYGGGSTERQGFTVRDLTLDGKQISKKVLSCSNLKNFLLENMILRGHRENKGPGVYLSSLTDSQAMHIISHSHTGAGDSFAMGGWNLDIHDIECYGRLIGDWVLDGNSAAGEANDVCRQAGSHPHPDPTPCYQVVGRGAVTTGGLVDSRVSKIRVHDYSGYGGLSFENQSRQNLRTKAWDIRVERLINGRAINGSNYNSPYTNDDIEISDFHLIDISGPGIRLGGYNHAPNKLCNDFNIHDGEIRNTGTDGAIFVGPMQHSTFDNIEISGSRGPDASIWSNQAMDGIISDDIKFTNMKVDRTRVIKFSGTVPRATRIFWNGTQVPTPTT
jgi:hypothetical protein